MFATKKVKLVFCLVTLLLASKVALATNAQSNYIEELTWTEVRDRIQAGGTTILIPIGGTEQNGPHMVLGKHNVRVHALAGKIAQALGNALVAPVIAYVPEGSIHPPAAHMRFAGTISISDATFEALLESTARSFKQHGFHDVFFLGDHGGYQKNEEKVAAKLNHDWAGDPACRVYALLDYYTVTQNSYLTTLRSNGYSDFEIGLHAGLADTSLALAIDKNLVRTALLADSTKSNSQVGVYGDPHRSSAEVGELGVRQIVQTSVSAIQAIVRGHRQ